MTQIRLLLGLSYLACAADTVTMATNDAVLGHVGIASSRPTQAGKQ